MLKAIQFAQVVISVIIITCILLQNKSSGLGTVFGGGDGNVFHAKRGAEKWLFYGTCIAVILFVALGVANLFLQQTV